MEAGFTLPDGRKSVDYCLAKNYHLHSSLNAIADGADPATFPLPENNNPIWGLLYVLDDSIGFFVHASEAQMAMMFRLSRDDEQRPIHISIPIREILRVSLDKPRDPKTVLGKFFRALFGGRETVFSVYWRSNDREMTLRFMIERKNDDFERGLRAAGLI